MNKLAGNDLLKFDAHQGADRGARPRDRQPLCQGCAGDEPAQCAPLYRRQADPHRQTAPHPRSRARAADRGEAQHPDPQDAGRFRDRSRLRACSAATARSSAASMQRAKPPASAAAACTAIARWKAPSSAAACSRAAMPDGRRRRRSLRPNCARSSRRRHRPGAQRSRQPDVGAVLARQREDLRGHGQQQGRDHSPRGDPDDKLPARFAHAVLGLNR